MKLGAHIGVKDEIEVLPYCINHLRDSGVSSFIVCDMQSIDGSREYLKSQESDDFRIIDSSNEEPDNLWRQRNVAAIRECSADWVLMIDADEFPLTTSGDLCEALARIDADVLSIPRYNVVLGPDGASLPFPCSVESFDKARLIVKAPAHFQKKLDEEPDFPWIRNVPLPKCAVRPSVLGGLCDGMHDIIPVENIDLRRRVSDDILIAHLPLTSFSRFKRKIQNARDVLKHHEGVLGPQWGWHWKRWIELDQKGILHEEFRNSKFTPSLIEELEAAGYILTVHDMLAENSGKQDAQPQ